MSKIPGFRTGKVWKKALATFGYFIILTSVVSVATGHGGNGKSSPVTAPAKQESKQISAPDQQKTEGNKPAIQPNPESAVAPLIKDTTPTPTPAIPVAATPTPTAQTIPTPPAATVEPTSNPVPSVTPAAAPTPTVAQAPAEASKQDVTVYITKSGTKYHNEGCRTLSKGKTPISLTEAKAKSYTPCSICNPPQ